MSDLKKICLFSSYSNLNKIDNYVKFYLTELKNYFDEIIFITNERSLEQESLDYLNTSNITLKYVENRGYDYGMYYHVIKDLDMKKYQNLALINDSCYLFKSLSNFFLWHSNQPTLDCAGMTDSIFKGHHIQSYFLIFSRRVLQLLKAYFVKNGIIEDVIKLIETYEIGFCKYLIENKFKIGAMYSQKMLQDHSSNIMTEAVPELLARGIPLIKRKLIHNTFREDEISYLEHVKFDFSTDYRKLLYNYADRKTLDYLLQNFSVKVYQIYYDVEQIKNLSPDTLPYYNSKLTVYFENDLIKNFYNSDKIEADYFGILSWRFSEKNNVQFRTSFIDGKYDMYAFANSAIKQDVFADSVLCHPYFMELFTIVLKNLKIDTNIKPSLGLYQNTIITRTSIYKKYVAEFLIPTMNLLDRFAEKYIDLNQKLWSDAKYKYDPALTQRLFEQTGKPYYTYHTFICERLWTVFYEIYKSQYSLKILDQADYLDTTPSYTPIVPQRIFAKGSSVEQKTPLKAVEIFEKVKDYAICISHTQAQHNLEKINQENRIYDFYLTSTENINIQKWQNFFKKHKIISSKSIEDNSNSRLDKNTLQNMYLCSAVNQLWQEEEQITKQKYKVIIYSNSLTVLSNLIDVHKIKIQTNTLYIKKSPVKYWFGKADLMSIFSQLFLDQKYFQNGSIDDVIVQFALRRNIKIIEV